MQKKKYIGRRLKRIREDQGLTQARMAEAIGVSTSYLNQLERNQRPLSDRVLARLIQTFGVSPDDLDDEEEHRLVRDLTEILVDPVFGEIPPARAETLEAMRTSPKLGRHLLNLYRSYRSLRTRVENLTENPETQTDLDGIGMTRFPYEDVRDLIQDHNNYFDRLDRGAEFLWDQYGWSSSTLLNDLERYLQNKHGVMVVEQTAHTRAYRHFDPDNATLTLSHQLSGSSRAFHMAHQLALLDHQHTLKSIIQTAGLGSTESEAIAHIALANYFAGAVLMPYTDFLREAAESRHDISRLQQRFGVSFEQVCHRLSTMQRPRAEGVPFYFLRVDMAGNVSKQQTANSFRFARFGGSCPLWNVHDAFASPGRILTQLVQLPNNDTYLSLARAIEKGGDGYLDHPRRFAVGLGCAAEHAHKVVYSAHIDLHNTQAATPVGASCRVCPRTACKHRAFPPVGKSLEVDHLTRSTIPYAFK